MRTIAERAAYLKAIADEAKAKAAAKEKAKADRIARVAAEKAYADRAKKRARDDRDKRRDAKAKAQERKDAWIAKKRQAAIAAAATDPAALPVREAWVAKKACAPVRAPAWPQSLDALATKCGPYGDTAIAEAKAAAMDRWALPGLSATLIPPKGNAKANPEAVLWEVLPRHRRQIWRDAGAAPHPGYAKPVLLDDLSPDSRCEAERVIAETYAEWEAAGSPGLDQPALIDAYKRLVGNVWSGCLPPFDGCPKCPDHLKPQKDTA
jgi:hypothetical protein